MRRNFSIFTAVLLGGALAHADDGVSVGGYVDVQYNWSNISNYGGARNVDKNVNTFRFNEGAVYLGKKVGGAEVFVDLDLAGPAKASNSGFATGVTSSAITVGGAKSQAYVAMDYDNGFSWKLGQFDALFGYEPADSHELAYTEAGILAANMPITHTGLTAGYEFSDMFAVNFLIANPYDQGHMKNGNFDYGLKVNTNFDKFAFNIGGLISTGDHAASGAKKESGFIIDTDLSADFGMWHGALYGFAKKNDLKGAEVDFGAGLDLGYEFSDSFHWGLRFEYEKDGTDKSVLAGTSDDHTMEVTTGPQFHLAEGLVAKVDYTFKQITYDTAGVDAQTDHIGNLAAVFKF